MSILFLQIPFLQFMYIEVGIMRIKFVTFILLFLSLFLSAQTQEVQEVQKTDQKTDQKENADGPKFEEIKEKVSLIVMKSSDNVIYRTVNITPTEVVVLEFPKGVLLDGDPASSIAIGHDAILQTDLVPSPLVIKVTALQNQVNLNSNLQVKLNCGITIIFNFRITLPDKASNRIIFTYPEWTEKNAKQRDELLELKVKLQKEHTRAMEKVKAEAAKMRVSSNTKSFSEFFMCNEYVNRSEENLVFFTSTRICKFGGKRDMGGDIYINFYIKNRYRNFFYVKSIKVYGLNGEQKVPIDGVEVHLEKYGIQFDEVLNGAVGFMLDEYYRQYVIELEEEAGKKRKIQVTVGF